MPLTSEQLTSQFYQWELLGRGWIHCDGPVELEAPFTPFFGHFPWSGTKPTYKDDGLRHTLFSKFLSLFSSLPPEEKEDDFTAEISYEAIALQDEEEIVIWQLILSRNAKYTAVQTEQFLSMLSYVTRPMSFELIGTAEQTVLQLTCREQDRSYLRSQVHTYFPGVGLLEVSDNLADVDDYSAYATIDFGLEQEFTRPLQNHHALDPFTSFFTILEHLEEGEKVVFQVLFNGVVNHWENSILRSVSDGGGKSFFADAPEMVSLGKEKVSKPLLVASVRCLVFAQSIQDAFSILHKACFAVQKTYTSPSNSLVTLSHEGYTVEQRFSDICLRQSHRLGMLLNTEELASLVHLPAPALLTPKVLGKYRKTKLPPPDAMGGDIILGISEDGGKKVSVTLSNQHRLKHMHVIGATGTGKSTLLTSMIIQDMEQRNGVAVLDPHGDLIEIILQHVPEHRMKDVIIIDPADSEYPVGFNILQAHSEIEKETLASDLVSAFKRLSTSWGDQMHSVLSNAILAFLESTKGGTLLDLRRFLLETPYRTEFLKSVDDYSVLYYWQKQYPILKSGSIGPILTRLDNFLRSRLIRNMVAQRKSLDFEAILDKQKILLVKLSQGLIGEENSYLLGSFVVSKLHQAALARQAKDVRKDFFFYIDEFQHFTTPSMAAILSGARKYHLGLVLAHQDMQQLSRGESELAGSVLSNAGTRICFRLSEADAKRLAEGFSYFDAQDLQNLSIGESIGRIEKPEYDFSLTTIPLVQSAKNTGVNETVLALSRKLYASSRADIEKELLQTIQITAEPEKSSKQEEQKLVAPKEPVLVEKKEADTRIKSFTQVPQPITTNTTEEAVQALTEKLVKQKQESTHRYLQNLIKRLAETKGFKATIEAPLPKSDGRIDVLLENTKHKIACEISVTTDITWELHNIEKCLQAGFAPVISCVTDTKTKARFLEKIAQTFTKAEQQHIKVYETEELFLYLETLNGAAQPEVQTVKGYRVKVNYDTSTFQEQHQKKQAVAKVVLNAMKRMKSE